MAAKIPYQGSVQFIPLALSPPKRYKRIANTKLPSDFFGDELSNQNSYRFGTANWISQPCANSSKVNSRENIRKMTAIEGVQSYSRTNSKKNVSRQTYTARDKDYENHEMNLIMSVINSTREMKQALRKRSVQLKKQVFPSKKKDDLYFELPPILLRKGITTPF